MSAMKLDKKALEAAEIIVFNNIFNNSSRAIATAAITTYFEALQASGKAELLENSPGLVSISRRFLAAELPVLIIRMEE